MEGNSEDQEKRDKPVSPAKALENVGVVDGTSEEKYDLTLYVSRKVKDRHRLQPKPERVEKVAGSAIGSQPAAARKERPKLRIQTTNLGPFVDDYEPDSDPEEPKDTTGNDFPLEKYLIRLNLQGQEGAQSAIKEGQTGATVASSVESSGTNLPPEESRKDHVATDKEIEESSDFKPNTVTAEDHQSNATPSEVPEGLHSKDKDDEQVPQDNENGGKEM